MTSSNVIHVTHDSCCAQRKRVILISNILDFREKQHPVTKRLSSVSSGFNTEKEDGTNSFFTLFPTTYKQLYISNKQEFYISLFTVSIMLSSTYSITLLSYFGISSHGILLKISYGAFEINSLR